MLRRRFFQLLLSIPVLPVAVHNYARGQTYRVPIIEEPGGKYQEFSVGVIESIDYESKVVEFEQITKKEDSGRGIPTAIVGPDGKIKVVVVDGILYLPDPDPNP